MIEYCPLVKDDCSKFCRFYNHNLNVCLFVEMIVAIQDIRKEIKKINTTKQTSTPEKSE